MSERPNPPAAGDVRRAERAWSTLETLGGLSATGDLADRWGLHERRARTLVRSDGFPAPVARLGGRDLWLTIAADAWRAAQPGPGKSRPPA